MVAGHMLHLSGSDGPLWSQHTAGCSLRLAEGGGVYANTPELLTEDRDGSADAGDEPANWDGPSETERKHLRYATAQQLSDYLEHDGHINDEDAGYSYLEAMGDAGIFFDEDDPAVLAVWEENDGTVWASLWDGNHRLHLALAEGPTTSVPYIVSREVSSMHPGFPYDGALG